jgi:hypothetical protein
MTQHSAAAAVLTLQTLARYGLVEKIHIAVVIQYVFNSTTA